MRIGVLRRACAFELLVADLLDPKKVNLAIALYLYVYIYTHVHKPILKSWSTSLLQVNSY